MIRTSVLWLFSLSLGACYVGIDPATADTDGGSAGTDGGSAGGTDTGGSAACEDADLDMGFGGLRRLTRDQYTNTIRDLLGLDADVSTIPFDEKVGPFNQNAVAPVSQLGVDAYMAVAEDLAELAVADLPGLLPCDPTADGESACADHFIRDFGRRAFRRPLEDAELTRYRAVYDTAASNGEMVDGIRLTISAFLQSPHFLYHLELTPAAGTSDLVALGGHALASRLSYFLWNTMPDDELAALADAGTLTDPDTLHAQAERMLADARAKDAIGTFHVQWLEVEDLESVEKDPTMHPGFDLATRQALIDETATFADYVIRDGDGTLHTLLTAPFTVFESPLFDLYGIEQPAGWAPGDVVQLDPDQRAGLLTHASLLAKNAHVDQSSPIHRGVVVRENFLCQPLPPPPPDVDNIPPEVDPDATTRERFEQHTKDPACAGCHSLIDGIGFGFEHYDAVGAYRDLENGLPVDASGNLVGTDDINGEFDGAIELASLLAGSEEVQQCVTRQWFRFAFGRFESEQDMCTLEDLDAVFQASGQDISRLLLALVDTEAFRHRRLSAPEMGTNTQGGNR